MNLDPAPPPFIHYNLRTGGCIQAPRAWEHPLKGAVEAAIRRSQHEDGAVEVTGTPFALFASQNTLHDGNAPFCLTASAPLGGGRVPTDSNVYAAVVACQLATAPLGWRHILRYYLGRVAVAPPLSSFGAPGPMPQAMPWLCGFLVAEADPITKDERATLAALIRLTGAILLRECERACQEVANSGGAPEANPDQFPELRSWAD